MLKRRVFSVLMLIALGLQLIVPAGASTKENSYSTVFAEQNQMVTGFAPPTADVVGEVTPFMVKIQLFATVPQGGDYFVTLQWGFGDGRFTWVDNYFWMQESITIPYDVEVAPGETMYYRALVKDRVTKEVLSYGEWNHVDIPAADEEMVTALEVNHTTRVTVTTENMGMKYYSFTADETGVYQFTVSDSDGAVFPAFWGKYDVLWGLEQPRTTVTQELNAGDCFYVRANVCEPGTLSIDVRKAEIAESDLEKPRADIDLDWLDPFCARVDITANLPEGKPLWIGCEYGESQDNPKINLIEYGDASPGVVSTLCDIDTLPGTTIWYRPFVLDSDECVITYGDWQRVTTPKATEEDYTKLVLNEQCVDDINEENVYFRFYYAFTSEKTGIYSVMPSQPEIEHTFKRFAFKWWNGEAWELICVEEKTMFLVEGETAYFMMHPQNKGEFSIVVVEGIPPVAEQIDQLKAFDAEVIISAKVPIGASFELGIEYGSNQEKTTVTAKEYQSWASETVRESFIAEVIPGTTIWLRPILVNTATGQEYIGKWQSFTTPALEEDTEEVIPLPAEAPVSVTVSEEDLGVPVYFSFTAPISGWYTLTGAGDLAGITYWDDRWTAMDETGAAFYSPRSAPVQEFQDVVVWLEAGESLYVRAIPETVGSYELTLSPGCLDISLVSIGGFPPPVEELPDELSEGV